MSACLRSCNFIKVRMKIINRSPENRCFSALLTDLDGTLIHSQDAICDAVLAAFEAVNIHKPSKEDLLNMFGLPVEEMLIRLGGVDRYNTQLISDFISAYKEKYPFFMSVGAHLIPNAKETVDRISFLGYPICLVTSERRKNAEFILQKLELSDSIKKIVSRDDVTKFKPDPEPILKAAQKTKQPPEQCVYIGESPFDIKSGKNAGVFVVAVASGNWSADSLLDCDPDIMVEDISELLSVFELSLNKK